MKRVALTLVLAVLATGAAKADSWIRINQLGYLPGSVKVAVYLSQVPVAEKSFTVYDAFTDKPVFRGAAEICDGAVWGMAAAARLDFSGLPTPGGYYIIYSRTKSETFRLGANVYDGTADFILNYIRQQRCGMPLARIVHQAGDSPESPVHGVIDFGRFQERAPAETSGNEHFAVFEHHGAGVLPGRGHKGRRGSELVFHGIVYFSRL